MFTKSERSLIEEATKLLGNTYEVSYAIRMGQPIVKLSRPVDNKEDLTLARCGIFSQFTQESWDIIDVLGTTKDFSDGEEILVLVSDGKVIFQLFPNISYIEGEILTPVFGNWQKFPRKQLLETAIERINNGETVQQVTEDVVGKYFIGLNIDKAELRFSKDLMNLLDESGLPYKIGQQVWMVVTFKGKVVRIKGEVVEVRESVVVAKSNRTKKVYEVTPEMVFENRPPAEVVK